MVPLPESDSSGVVSILLRSTKDTRGTAMAVTPTQQVRRRRDALSLHLQGEADGPLHGETQLWSGNSIKASRQPKKPLKFCHGNANGDGGIRPATKHFINVHTIN